MKSKDIEPFFGKIVKSIRKGRHRPWILYIEGFETYGCEYEEDGKVYRHSIRGKHLKNVKKDKWNAFSIGVSSFESMEELPKEEQFQIKLLHNF